MDDGGFVSIMARTDDVINVAGHRISTKSLEEVKYFIAFILGSAWFKWNNILAIATDLSVYLQDLVRSLSINASSETYRRIRNNFLLCFQGMIRLDFVIDAACVGLEDPIKGHLPVGFIVIDKSTRMSLLRNWIGDVYSFQFNCYERLWITQCLESDTELKKIAC